MKNKSSKKRCGFLGDLTLLFAAIFSLSADVTVRGQAGQQLFASPNEALSCLEIGRQIA